MLKILSDLNPRHPWGAALGDKAAALSSLVNRTTLAEVEYGWSWTVGCQPRNEPDASHIDVLIVPE